MWGPVTGFCLYLVPQNDISRPSISNVSPPTCYPFTAIHPHPRPTGHIRNELASWRNTAPESSASDLRARHWRGYVLGDGRGLDCGRFIGFQDSCLQLPHRRVESDVGWL